MTRNRLEAFSDGVLAIVITIMVLELKAPRGASWQDLRPLGPLFGSYVLSFLYVGIYWNNHHHLFQSVERVSARILWANLHLLFWLSLLPLATAWAGNTDAAPTPVAAYGFVLLMAGSAYYILQHAIIGTHGSNSLLARAIGRDWKGKMSPVLYVFAIAAALADYRLTALAVYLGVAAMWLIPDRRIERELLGKYDK